MKVILRTRMSLWLFTGTLVALSPSRLFAQDAFWDYIHELSGPKVNAFGIEVPLFPRPALFTLAKEDFSDIEEGTYQLGITIAYAGTPRLQDTNDPVDPQDKFRAHFLEPAFRWERYSPQLEWSRALALPEILRIGYGYVRFQPSDDTFESFSNDAVSLTPMWNLCPGCLGGVDILAGPRFRFFRNEFTPQDFGESTVGEGNGGGEFAWALIVQFRIRAGRLGWP